MAGIEKKRFEQSDDVRPFKEGKGELRVVPLEDKAVGMATFEPGWRWSDHVKPIAGTDSCQSHHTGYMISGHMTVRMNDGTEENYDPGDVMAIAPGHDAWVVGQEPCVVLDWLGYSDYAKPGAAAKTTTA
jgi:quercetin dioxygenase-like cupin family protein